MNHFNPLVWGARVAVFWHAFNFVTVRDALAEIERAAAIWDSHGTRASDIQGINRGPRGEGRQEGGPERSRYQRVP